MKRILLILVFITMCAYALGAPQTALDVNIGGVHIKPQDLVEVITSAAAEIEKAAQQSRKAKESAIVQLESQRVELGRQKDRGGMGDAEYEQARAVLSGKIERLYKEIEQQDQSATTVSNNIQSVLMNGWQAVLDNYRDEQQRKTQIGAAAATQAVANEGRKEQVRMELDASMQKLRFMSDPTNLKYYALFAAGAAAGIAGGYYGVRFAYRWAEQKLEKLPELALKTSRIGWLAGVKASFWSLFGYEKPVVTLEENVIFAPDLEEQLKAVAQTTQLIHDKGLTYPAMLLYGPPGTGKTWYATLLAQMSGMDYVITSADRFAQFAEGHDVQAVHELFDWAESSPRGMIIFVDEIDALGCKRDKLDQRWVRLLNAFLARTGTSSDKFKVVGATNRIDALDPAFVDRFAQRFYIGLPAAAERERMFNLYLDKYIRHDKRTIIMNGEKVEAQLTINPDITPEYVKEVAQKTEGWSGRTIEQLVDDVRTRCYMSDGLTLTKKIFDDAVAAMNTSRGVSKAS